MTVTRVDAAVNNAYIATFVTWAFTDKEASRTRPSLLIDGASVNSASSRAGIWHPP